jgi:protein-S-isoprenylcysteine O-methyltransferase Ste14
MSVTRGEGPGVRFPPPLLHALGFGVAIALQRAVAWPLFAGHAVVRPAAGWAMVALGLATLAWGMATFAKARTAIFPDQPASRLVNAGPYRFTRNPMYLGLSVAYLGGALIVNSVWPVVILPVVLGLLYTFVIAREERYLAEAFGGEYDAYRKRVRRWL